MPSPAVVELLEKAEVEYVVHRHDAIRTGADILARTVFTGDDVLNSVKTLAFGLVSGGIVLAAIPGPGRVRYGQLAAAVGARRQDVRPAGPDLLGRLDMEPGGVTPLCAHPSVTVVVDSAVTGMGRVLCGSGRSDCTLEMASSDVLGVVPGIVVADIATP
jgi:Cys-tRNA(Pro)/Cys-tRNA(Cys) deacylase